MTSVAVTGDPLTDSEIDDLAAGVAPSPEVCVRAAAELRALRTLAAERQHEHARAVLTLDAAHRAAAEAELRARQAEEERAAAAAARAAAETALADLAAERDALTGEIARMRAQHAIDLDSAAERVAAATLSAQEARAEVERVEARVAQLLAQRPA